MRRVVFVVIALVFVLFSIGILPTKAFAEIGVGVGTGKIVVDEPIKAGAIYELPSIIVYNTGDQTAKYAMHVTLNETQDELKPDLAWFSFGPNGFNLEPGKSQLVTATFKPPINTEPGKYFGYLEAYPDTSVDQGSATIGVAAAAKMYFEVEKSNSLQALLNRAKALYQYYAPWTYIIIALIMLFIPRAVLKKYLKINIQISTTKKPAKSEPAKVENVTNDPEINEERPKRKTNTKKNQNKKKGTAKKTSKSK